MSNTWKNYTSDHHCVAALIKAVVQSPAGQISVPEGGTWDLQLEGGEKYTVSHAFFNFHRPDAGAYLVRRQGERPTIVSGSAFEAYHREHAAVT